MTGLTNWCVITGGPSSGKTTTVNLLRNRGYVTTIEHARHYIDVQRVGGRSVEEIRANQMAFQRGIIAMQIEQEESIDPAQLVFLDRALPDALAYFRFLGLTPPPEYLGMLRRGLYRVVLVLDLLPLAADYARTEDSDAQVAIHGLIAQAYAELGYTPIAVPALEPEERVDWILARLRQDGLDTSLNAWPVAP